MFRTRTKHNDYILKVLINSRLFKEILQTLTKSDNLKNFLMQLTNYNYHLEKLYYAENLDDMQYCAFIISNVILEMFVSITPNLGTTDISLWSCHLDGENSFGLALKLLYELHYDADVD